MTGHKNRFFLAVLLAGGLVFTSSLAAKDVKPSYLGTWKNTEFKLGGLLYSGYEFLDTKDNGTRDSAGPTSENAGFKVGRAYLNLKGKVKGGNYKGWGFRLTTDVVPFAEEGNGCGTSCSGDNDYTLILKYAFVSMPIKIAPASLGKTWLRLGQQHNPTVDAKNGFSMQSYWGHRYIARTSWEDFGFSGSSADRGLALIHKHKYYGFHLLVANGEGYHHNNAENIKNSSISNLSSGTGDSYGLDAYGMFSISPTGKRDKKAKGDYTEISVNFPFRFKNFIGVDSSETRNTTADFTVATPTFTHLIGDARAKKDVAYGVEGDFSMRRGSLTITVGGGTAVNIDRRANAYKIDNNGFDINDPSVLVTEVALGKDARAWANYAFAHFRLGSFGGFFRYTYGSATGTLSRKAAAPNGKSWVQQAVELDAVDGTLGNLDYTTARTSIDLGRGRLRNVILGVTWHPTDSSSVSVGVSLLRVQKTNGETLKNNDLERIAGEGTTTSNLATQLESNGVLKGQLGFHGSENPDLNDFIGKKNEDRQVFLRTAFKF